MSMDDKKLFTRRTCASLQDQFVKKLRVIGDFIDRNRTYSDNSISKGSNLRNVGKWKKRERQNVVREISEVIF